MDFNPTTLLVSALMGVATGVLAWASRDYYGQLLNFVEADLKDKLRRLRMSTRKLRAYLHTWTVGVLVIFVGFTILGAMAFGVLFSVLLISGPWYLIRRMAEKRKQQIEDQLADAMVSLSSAIKAGLSLGQSLEILAQQCPKPISEEFNQMVNEYKMGKPLERVLLETRDRLKSENFALFAAAMEASRESGGRLNETVDRIAHSVLELQRLERKIKSETSQARTSAIYMALAPAAILGVYYFVLDPVNTMRLFTTVPGQLMLCTAVVLNVAAYLWARSILNADI